MHSTVRKLFVAAVAVVAVMMSVSTGVGNAAAEEDAGAQQDATIQASAAHNQKQQYLRANPAGGLSASYATRRVYLRSGTYLWQHSPTAACKRTITLKAGWYTWIDQLLPRNGYYDHYSYLDPDAAGGTALTRCAWDPSPSGTYLWGSGLYPRPPY